ncbi:MAG: ABC transporter permease, partial [Acidobacteria bacterium]|nr:ABC transporter permease [Acidobacteriota bacterium]
DVRLAIHPPVPFSGRETDLEAILRPPDRLHWLGTDSLGRDVAARMIHGAGASMTVGVGAVGIAAGIGVLLGAVAGLFGGWVDSLLSRLLEVAFCFPTLFLILALVGIPGSRGVLPIVLAIGITRWTPIARYVRGEFLSLRERDFVRSARAAGASDGRILLRHLVPHSLPPVIVTAAFGVAGAVLLETALSFLGFGIQPPAPSWGNVLAEARDALGRGWWLAVWPTAAIFLTVLGFNWIGEGLRDRIDPRRGEWATDGEDRLPARGIKKE